MVLKLDPRYPLVWRTPSSLQLGVASPVTTLRDVSTATEHMLAALSVGISRSGLSMIGTSAGATEDQVEALLDEIAPALVPTAPAPEPPVVLLVGSGPTLVRTAEALAASGVTVRIATEVAAAARQQCALAIVFAHFVVAPELFGLWLRRDIPHLAVVLSDTDLEVGPVIEPGAGPCLYCLQRYRAEADPAWTAILTQLYGRSSAAETALVSTEAASVVARLALRRLRSGPATVHESVTLSAETGATETRAWLPHPGCGCIEVTS